MNKGEMLRDNISWNETAGEMRNWNQYHERTVDTVRLFIAHG